MSVDVNRKRKVSSGAEPATRKRSAKPESAMAKHFAASRRPVKAAETLAREIFDFIIENGIAAGTRLAPERQMLADTGRARGTLREALRLLESRGVVEVRPGAAGGAFVRQPLPADLGAAITTILMFEGASMSDVLAAREDMEVAAVARAARRIRKKHLDQMQDSVDRLLERPDDRERFLVESSRFHAVINEVAGSPVLRILNDALRTTQMISTSEFSISYRKRVADEHQAIIDALRAGDTLRACDLMRAHINTSAHSWKQESRTSPRRDQRRS
jgi:DNA-binding FadR family transcriptional regulator